MNFEIKETPEIVLREIAQQVMHNAGCVKDSSLFNGRMGISIFLYHYAQCYDNNSCLQLANQLIEEIFDSIDEVTTDGYSNGLAGIGAGFEYLAAKGFIEADVNELLADADTRIYECIQYEPAKSVNMLNGTTGFGKYCLLRFHTLRSNVNQTLIDINRECISQIIDQLQASYLWYPDLLSVIDFLSEVYWLKINEEKVKHFIGYAFNKLETIVYEDLHFGSLPADCNPLRIMAVCLLAAKRTKNPVHYDSALRIVNAFRKNPEYINEAGTSDVRLLKQALICKKLSAGLQQEHFAHLSAERLKLFLNKQRKKLAGLQPFSAGKSGIVDGLAGEGLALLTLIEKIPMDWMDQLVVYH
jgi:hypothetical protein